MKKILLISNASFEMKKIEEQNELLINAAKELNCQLDIKSNIEVSCDLMNDVEIKYDAILFYDKDILLAKKLENLGLKVINSSKSIEICDNKAKTQIYLEKNNIPTPKTYILPLTFFYNIKYFGNFVQKLIKKLGLPLVAKEWYGSWGEQVYLLRSQEEIFDLIETKNGKELLFQEYIEESAGDCIRLNVVNGKVVAAMRRRNTNDFRANISSGGVMENYIPSKDEIDLAQKAAKCVGCNFCGVDILKSNRGPLICELNSNAHLININKCTGVNVGKLILESILCKI